MLAVWVEGTIFNAQRVRICRRTLPNHSPLLPNSAAHPTRLWATTCELGLPSLQDPSRPDSLHRLVGAVPNAYQQALSAVGGILTPYDRSPPSLPPLPPALGAVFRQASHRSGLTIPSWTYPGPGGWLVGAASTCALSIAPRTSTREFLCPIFPDAAGFVRFPAGPQLAQHTHR